MLIFSICGSAAPLKISPMLLASLSSVGATCYLNSLLQSLYFTPEFRDAIFRWR